MVANGAICGGREDRRIVDVQDKALRGTSLDVLGVSQGSSLSSLDRDLLATWEEHLFPRDTPDLDILQIGVGHGGSVRTWANWFPHARVTGLDVRRISIRNFPANVEIAHGDQTDAVILGGLCREHAFRLVVDDGSDDPSHKLHTFLTVFPWLAPGALYLCVNSESQDALMTSGNWDRLHELPTTTIGSWFGQLGGALVSGVRPVPPLWTSLEVILQRAASVVCLPGSVMVRGRT